MARGGQHTPSLPQVHHLSNESRLQIKDFGGTHPIEEPSPLDQGLSYSRDLIRGLPAIRTPFNLRRGVFAAVQQLSNEKRFGSSTYELPLHIGEHTPSGAVLSYTAR